MSNFIFTTQGYHCRYVNEERLYVHTTNTKQTLLRDRLTQPEPELLQRIAGNLFRPDLGVESSLTAPNISLGGVNLLGLLEDLPEQEQEAENWDTDVGSEEVGELVRAPRSLGEDLEAVEDDDQSEVHEGNPSKVWLRLTLEGKSVAVNTLSDESLTEVGVSVADGAPCEQLSNGGKVLEPQEDSVGTSAD